jgi:hypothetical protein
MQKQIIQDLILKNILNKKNKKSGNVSILWFLLVMYQMCGQLFHLAFADYQEFIVLSQKN